MTTARGASALGQRVYSVLELARELKQLLETSYPDVWVEGEISNLAAPRSGHLYFSLKDAGAVLRCALFRNRRERALCEPADGMRVLVRGRVSLYEGRGDCQLIVHYLEDAGEGALRRAFEELKRRLDREGLFDPAHKRALPAFPRRVGVLTSPSGAAIRDILSALRRRFASLPVLVYPVPVQGEAAAEAIAATIRFASDRRDCDVLILARGGGSLEDLQAFNDERVARAVFASEVPIVTGIGHEIDFTIADFVADRRAATPTAAAELVSPNGAELERLVTGHRRRLRRLSVERLNRLAQHVDHLQRRLVHPRQRLSEYTRRLAALRREQMLIVHARLQRSRLELARQGARLRACSPQRRLERLAHRRSVASRILQRDLRQRLQSLHGRLDAAGARLAGVSPTATLARGYAIVRRPPGGALVRDAAQARPGDRVSAELARGKLLLLVERADD